MTNEKQWYQDIYSDLIQNNKRLIFIAGGSSSGKSHNAELLEKFLEEKGLRVMRFSTDNYYKGLSWVIVERTINLDEFKKYRPYLKQITKSVKEITEQIPFKDKFAPNNFYQIMNKLSGIISQEDIFKFVSHLKYEQENMNFDDPFDINFDWIVDTIDKLKNKQVGTLCEYSFNTSEVCEDLIKEVDGAKYDAIVVEGLYILRPEVLKAFEPSDYVSANIDCNAKTRLIRRLHRDIFTDRCSLTPEETIMTVLKNVMPAYLTEIEPTFKHSNHELSNDLTEYEKNAKELSSQTKYIVTMEARDVVADFLAGDLVDLKLSEEIKDVYLQDSKQNNDITLRLRISNGNLHLLSFKIGNDTQNRRVEHFPLHKYLSDVRNVSSFIKMLQASGFTITNVITKTREVYTTNKFSGVNEFRVDFVKNLGVFFEFIDANEEEMQEFIKTLDLKRVPNKSYEAMYDKIATKMGQNLHK